MAALCVQGQIDATFRVSVSAKDPLHNQLTLHGGLASEVQRRQQDAGGHGSDGGPARYHGHRHRASDGGAPLSAPGSSGLGGSGAWPQQAPACNGQGLAPALQRQHSWSAGSGAAAAQQVQPLPGVQTESLIVPFEYKSGQFHGEHKLQVRSARGPLRTLDKAARRRVTALWLTVIVPQHAWQHVNSLSALQKYAHTHTHTHINTYSYTPLLHLVQVLLYLLLMEDRYRTAVRKGLLFHRGMPHMASVAYSHATLASVMVKRNRLAAHLVGAASRPPPPLGSGNNDACSRCYAKTACAVYLAAEAASVQAAEAAAQGGAGGGADAAAAATQAAGAGQPEQCSQGLSARLLGSVHPELRTQVAKVPAATAAFFAHWCRLVDLEEQAARGSRSDVSDVPATWAA